MQTEVPWSDCKVEFPWNPPDTLELDDFGGLGLLMEQEWPDGWDINEVDGAGARWVAVFRIAGAPSVGDGNLVAQKLTVLEGGSDA